VSLSERTVNVYVPGPDCSTIEIGTLIKVFKAVESPTFPVAQTHLPEPLVHITAYLSTVTVDDSEALQLRTTLFSCITAVKFVGAPIDSLAYAGVPSNKGQKATYSKTNNAVNLRRAFSCLLP
jgi:hypothetical protein